MSHAEFEHKSKMTKKEVATTGGTTTTGILAAEGAEEASAVVEETVEAVEGGVATIAVAVEDLENPLATVKKVGVSENRSITGITEIHSVVEAGVDIGADVVDMKAETTVGSEAVVIVAVAAVDLGDAEVVLEAGAVVVLEAGAAEASRKETVLEPTRRRKTRKLCLTIRPILQ